MLLTSGCDGVGGGAGPRAAEPMELIAPGLPSPLPPCPVPHKGDRLLIPAPRGLLKPASDLLRAMRVLPIERAALEHALNGLWSGARAATGGRTAFVQRAAGWRRTWPDAG
jgi:hypothetical protein